MKLKKNTKIILGLILVIIIAVLVILIFNQFHFSKDAEGAKIIGSIDKYVYSLKDNKNASYKKMFHELEDILKKEEVDYEEYASKISEMFIYDFYSLEDKVAKNDIGGVQFLYPDIVSNFLENAESTYYKYVESNIYGNRKQDLPMVDKITIDSIEQISFTAETITDNKAYQVKVSWDYTENKYSDYQSEATLIIMHKDRILYIVELQ